MGRKAKLDPPVSMHVRLPTSLTLELNLLLWSDAHGKIPLGALSQFFEVALRKHLRDVQRGIEARTAELQDDIDNQLIGERNG